MCDHQRLRPACAYAQTDQSLCLSLEMSMTVKLLTEQNLELLSLTGAEQTRLSLHLSKCHIVGNHMSRLIYSSEFLDTYCSHKSLRHFLGHLEQILRNWSWAVFRQAFQHISSDVSTRLTHWSQILRKSLCSVLLQACEHMS